MPYICEPSPIRLYVLSYGVDEADHVAAAVAGDQRVGQREIARRVPLVVDPAPGAAGHRHVRQRGDGVASAVGRGRIVVVEAAAERGGVIHERAVRDGRGGEVVV